MTGVTLTLDGAKFADHLNAVAGATPGIVPVAKGNGYGFGLPRLAQEAALLGADTLAVGTAAEADTIRHLFGSDLVILQPWQAGGETAVRLAQDPQIITTVSRLSDLERIADLPQRPRVVVEVLTSMHRHGLAPDQLPTAAALLDRVRFEGWTIHLPLLVEGRYAEAERLSRAALAAAPGPLWLSHLPSEEAVGLARQLGGADGEPVAVRQRIGTQLWLGDGSFRRTTATVMDVHSVQRGQRAGYRQRRCPADGYVVVVAGGTSHGIGLEAPTPASTPRQRAIAMATGTLEAAGWALSPYTIAGRKRWFLEPPHMQSSLLFLPRSATPPKIGTEVPVELRLTTATVDRIVTT